MNQSERKFENYLRKIIGDDINIYDYWFENIDYLKFTYFKENTIDYDLFSLKARWKTILGIQCVKELRQYINRSQDDFNEIKNSLNNNGDEDIYFGKLDFANFTFKCDNKTYNLQNFSNSFPTSPCSGEIDFVGIDLSYLAKTGFIRDGILTP